MKIRIRNRIRGCRKNHIEINGKRRFSAGYREMFTHGAVFHIYFFYFLTFGGEKRDFELKKFRPENFCVPLQNRQRFLSKNEVFLQLGVAFFKGLDPRSRFFFSRAFTPHTSITVRYTSLKSARRCIFKGLNTKTYPCTYLLPIACLVLTCKDVSRLIFFFQSRLYACIHVVHD